jgi:F0F1-type ATP synthase membrane subunit b/b'
VIAEIFSEIAAEIAHEPLRFVAEIVQFALLIGIVWIVGFGFGSRKGFVRNMLAERALRTEASLKEALGAPEELSTARQTAASKARSARAEGRHAISAAKQEAAEVELSLHTEADAEAERVLSRVDEALETERAEMHAEIREELVDLVARATRQLLNERMTIAEQRRLIEEHVMASVMGQGDSASGEEA